jgi:hypothetical protein
LPFWLHHKIDKKKKEKRKSCGSFNGDFSPNFDLKNIILTYTKKNLMGKENGPNSPDFELKKIPNLARVL